MLRVNALSGLWATFLISAVSIDPVCAEVAHLTPIRATTAVSSFGINTHINYLDSTYSQFGNVKEALDYIGINHIRELSPMPWLSGAAPLGYYSQLIQKGYRIEFVIPGGRVDLNKSFGPILDLAASDPGGISSVEGFNEVDHWPVTFDGQTGRDAAIKGQEAIASFVHEDKRLNGVSVIDLTGASASPMPLDGRADFGNAHLYPQNGLSPDGWFRGMKALADKVGVSMEITEFGYASLPQSGWLVIGVDEQGQAKGVVTGLLSGIENGFARTYVYELLDEHSDPSNNDREQHFGLFDDHFRKKPAAVAVHNLVQLLRDSGSDAGRFSLRPVDLDIDGLPKTGHVVAVEKSDGSIWVALWNETPFWNNQSGTPVTGQPVTVSIMLHSGSNSSKIYHPLQSVEPEKVFGASQPVLVDLTNSPALVEFRENRPE